MARRSALDWGVKGPRAMSVGLGGWEYNLVIPRREAWITIPINNNPSPIGNPPPTNNNPQILILAGVFPFNAAPLSQFIKAPQA